MRVKISEKEFKEWQRSLRAEKEAAVAERGGPSGGSQETTPSTSAAGAYEVPAATPAPSSSSGTGQNQNQGSLPNTSTYNSGDYADDDELDFVLSSLDCGVFESLLNDGEAENLTTLEFILGEGNVDCINNLSKSPSPMFSPASSTTSQRVDIPEDFEFSSSDSNSPFSSLGGPLPQLSPQNFETSLNGRFSPYLGNKASPPHLEQQENMLVGGFHFTSASSPLGIMVEPEKVVPQIIHRHSRENGGRRTTTEEDSLQPTTQFNTEIPLDSPSSHLTPNNVSTNLELPFSPLSGDEHNPSATASQVSGSVPTVDFDVDSPVPTSSSSSSSALSGSPQTGSDNSEWLLPTSVSPDELQSILSEFKDISGEQHDQVQLPSFHEVANPHRRRLARSVFRESQSSDGAITYTMADTGDSNAAAVPPVAPSLNEIIDLAEIDSPPVTRTKRKPNEGNVDDDVQVISPPPCKQSLLSALLLKPKPKRCRTQSYSSSALKPVDNSQAYSFGTNTGTPPQSSQQANLSFELELNNLLNLNSPPISSSYLNSPTSSSSPYQSTSTSTAGIQQGADLPFAQYHHIPSPFHTPPSPTTPGPKQASSSRRNVKDTAEFKVPSQPVKTPRPKGRPRNAGKGTPRTKRQTKTTQFEREQLRQSQWEQRRQQQLQEMSNQLGFPPQSPENQQIPPQQQYNMPPFTSAPNQFPFAQSPGNQMSQLGQSQFTPPFMNSKAQQQQQQYNRAMPMQPRQLFLPNSSPNYQPQASPYAQALANSLSHQASPPTPIPQSTCVPSRSASMSTSPLLSNSGMPTPLSSARATPLPAGPFLGRLTPRELFPNPSTSQEPTTAFSMNHVASRPTDPGTPLLPSFSSVSSQMPISPSPYSSRPVPSPSPHLMQMNSGIPPSGRLLSTPLSITSDQLPAQRLVERQILAVPPPFPPRPSSAIQNSPIPSAPPLSPYASIPTPLPSLPTPLPASSIPSERSVDRSPTPLLARPSATLLNNLRQLSNLNPIMQNYPQQGNSNDFMTSASPSPHQLQQNSYINRQSSNMPYYGSGGAPNNNLGGRSGYIDLQNSYQYQQLQRNNQIKRLRANLVEQYLAKQQRQAQINFQRQHQQNQQGQLQFQQQQNNQAQNPLFASIPNPSGIIHLQGQQQTYNPLLPGMRSETPYQFAPTPTPNFPSVPFQSNHFARNSPQQQQQFQQQQQPQPPMQNPVLNNPPYPLYVYQAQQQLLQQQRQQIQSLSNGRAYPPPPPYDLVVASKGSVEDCSGSGEEIDVPIPIMQQSPGLSPTQNQNLQQVNSNLNIGNNGILSGRQTPAVTMAGPAPQRLNSPSFLPETISGGEAALYKKVNMPPSYYNVNGEINSGDSNNAGGGNVNDKIPTTIQNPVYSFSGGGGYAVAQNTDLRPSVTTVNEGAILPQQQEPLQLQPINYTNDQNRHNMNNNGQQPENGNNVSQQPFSPQQQSPIQNQAIHPQKDQHSLVNETMRPSPAANSADNHYDPDHHHQHHQRRNHLPHHRGDNPFYSQMEIDAHHHRVTGHQQIAKDSEFENEGKTLNWYLNKAKQALHNKHEHTAPHPLLNAPPKPIGSPTPAVGRTVPTSTLYPVTVHHFPNNNQNHNHTASNHGTSSKGG